MAGYLGNALYRRLDPSVPQLAAEIGVDRGQTSGWLLARLPLLRLYMIDLWAVYEHYPQPDARRDQNAHDRAKRMAHAITDFAQDRRIVIQAPSLDAVARIEDESLDMAFIDANHSYEGVSRDIEAYLPKVKSGGWLCGHDWEPKPPRKYGVNDAVIDFHLSSGIPYDLDEDATWFFRKP